VAAAAVCAALAIAAGACGGDDNPAFSDEVKQQFDAQGRARLAEIERKVRDGELPPVARVVINPDGTTNINFIDGPNGTEDIVRSGADGTTGRKLRWDLDQNGRIDRSERTITEVELYEATTRP
jgi:hypothetical protein